MYMIAAMVKPVFRVVFGYPVRSGLDDDLQGVTGTGLGRVQPGFKLAKGEFNGVEIGRVER